jgi:hypothetical protein
MSPGQIEDAIRETILIVADSSGFRVIRQRMETIGSSTEPSLPESAPEKKSALPLIACGSAMVFPRPMNCMRSVS